MGGRGGNSSEVVKNISVESLDSRIEKLQKQSMKVLNSREHSYDPTPQKYYDLTKQVRELQKKRSELLEKERQERLAARKEEPSHNKFVNSYGEATHREITSSSYRRAQRRLDREIDRRFKNR